MQWLLDHGTAYEGDFSTEDYFSLTQLQCYPEIALAVQGTFAHTCTCALTITHTYTLFMQVTGSFSLRMGLQLSQAILMTFVHW